MFRFVPVNTVKKVIHIEIPGDYGKTTPADFEAEFKRLKVSEARELIEAIRDKRADEEQTLRDNIVGLTGIQDPEGNEIPFSPELLDQLLDQAYIRGPLLVGFMDVTYNIEALKRKNSKG